MRVIRSSVDGQLNFTNPVVATLGNFDGVHRGHQALLNRVQQKKCELGSNSAGTSVAISFYPHPATVLGKVGTLPMLTSLRKKVELLSAQALDVLYLIHFTPKVAALSATQFIEQELFKRLNVRHLLVGPDARVGKGRQGTPDFMRDAFERCGRSFEVLPAVMDGQQRISSGIIREAIQQGQIEKARDFLGRNYSVQGRVVHGAGRGSKLGIPTANVWTAAQVLPQSGVYACMAKLEGAWHAAVVNIGLRPTISESQSQPNLEAHLLSFPDKSLYGKRLEIEFRARLREERKFSSHDALVVQIKADIELARKLLSYASGK